MNHKGERPAVMEIALNHLSLGDFARLVIAHDEVRVMADVVEDDGGLSPETTCDTEPVPTVSTMPMGLK